MLLVLSGTRPQPPAPARPSPFPQEVASVRLLAVGDILMHEDVKRSAREATAGLTGLWQAVEPLIRQADVAFANLETPVAPRTGRPGRPFQFNAPEDLPAALKASGFTVLSAANNHAYDQGVKGVVETLQRLQAEGLVAIGTGASRREAEQPRFVQVKGLRLAFLGFTDIFNVDLNRNPADPWVRPLDPAAAAAAVRAARAQADAVVVSIHWGVEYSHEPTARQRQVARLLAAAGADLILGHHPHVLQPVEMLENGGRRTAVIYSMGNFVSNQDRTYRSDRLPVAAGDSRDGVAFQCRLTRLRLADGSERVVLDQPFCEPLWTLNNWCAFNAGQARKREIRVVPVNATLAALHAGGPVDPGADRDLARTLQMRGQRVSAILGPAYVLWAGPGEGAALEGLNAQAAPPVSPPLRPAPAAERNRAQAGLRRHRAGAGIAAPARRPGPADTGRGPDGDGPGAEAEVQAATTGAEPAQPKDEAVPNPSGD